jgi:hypothetical protein
MIPFIGAPLAFLGTRLGRTLALIGGVALAVLTFGWTQRRAGARKVHERLARLDQEGAADVRESVEDRLDANRDVPAVERLRAQGRLRD